MPPKDEAMRAALEAAERFCERRTPSELADELRVEVVATTASLTIVERRAPWSPAIGHEWTRSEVASLRLDPRTLTWSLHWKRATGRWAPCDEVAPSSHIEPLLAAIDEDALGVFWG
jgi:DUF3024 family protein